MEILANLEQKGIRKAKLGIIDIDGVFRGKYVSLEKLRSILKKGFGFCDVVFGWDCADELYEDVDIKVTGLHTGYPDGLARVDLSTLRIIPWEPDTALLLADFYDGGGLPLTICPRQLLKRVQQRALDRGFVPYFASEYEFFLFKESPESLQEKGFRGLTPLSPGMFGYSILRASFQSDFVHDVIDSMIDFDVPVEGFHTETGPGVYECALRYTTALQAADRAALFKSGLKEIAHGHGIAACFMAKPFADMPGCSGHLHQSLASAQELRNLFYDPADRHQMSPLFRHYVAGVQKLAPELCVMYMPTINSYKRRVPGSWSPVNASWGLDNRTVSLRVIADGTTGTRVENRITSADINPYIAYSASLASGLYGIEHQLELGDPTIGNAYDDPDAAVLPTTLEAAVDRFERSDVARTLFGADFVEHFAATRRWEVNQYNKAVTDWEHRRYFEII